MKEVRTRFAPSPTGSLHIGGFRTALYAWLYARHFGGKFILRIEDTDQVRKVDGAVKYILDFFDWFDVEIDEGPSADELKKVGEWWPEAPNLGGASGPYIQSNRLPRYVEVAEELVAKGAAYRCDCTSEMLERERLEQMARKETTGYSGYCRTRNVSKDVRHVVRLKMPHKVVLSMEDAVKGRVSWDGVPLRDTVLLKSDGFPTYHLAVVVDDHDMKVTHVLRADEWLPSSPIHLMLYEALGWEKPIFGHLPNVMGADGKKLSKRHGSTSLESFREQGYLPEALLNYCVLVGWSPGEGDEQEVFTRDELIKKFSLDHVNRASAVFDYNKLLWMNGIYMRNLTVEDFTRRCLPLIEGAGLKIRQDRWNIIAPFVQERARTLVEVPPMVEFLFVDNIQRDIAAMFGKDIDANRAREILTEAHTRLSSCDFVDKNIEATLRAQAEAMGLKPGPMFGVIRIAVTGKKITPPLFESMAALGKEDSLKRILEAKELVHQVAA